MAETRKMLQKLILQYSKAVSVWNQDDNDFKDILLLNSCMGPTCLFLWSWISPKTEWSWASFFNATSIVSNANLLEENYQPDMI